MPSAVTITHAKSKTRAAIRITDPTFSQSSIPATLNWDVLARAEGTLVFYMPVGGLDSITASLTSLGRDPREPAILVEHAGVAGERVIAGRLGEIADEARAAGVGPPAVLITGPTVALASVPLSVCSPAWCPEPCPTTVAASPYLAACATRQSTRRPL